jgi:hypothetical protein
MRSSNKLKISLATFEKPEVQNAAMFVSTSRASFSASGQLEAGKLKQIVQLLS